MRRGEIEYVVSNGLHCIGFLEALAISTKDPRDHNRILNHALAVSALIDTLRSLNATHQKTMKELLDATDQLNKFEKQIYDDHIAKKIDEIKADLIDYINEF